MKETVSFPIQLDRIRNVIRITQIADQSMTKIENELRKDKGSPKKCTEVKSGQIRANETN